MHVLTLLYALELRPILVAVTPLALLALWLAFPAVTPQHSYGKLPMARLHARRSLAPASRPRDLHAKFHFTHLTGGGRGGMLGEGGRVGEDGWRERREGGGEGRGGEGRGGEGHTLSFRINGIAPVKFVCIYCTSICDNI